MPGYNSARGEVPLVIAEDRDGEVEIIIAAELGKLASLSGRIGCTSFQDLYLRLTSGELQAVLAGIELLTVNGDYGAALKSLTLADIAACSKAFKTALLHSAKGRPKKKVTAAKR